MALCAIETEEEEEEDEEEGPIAAPVTPSAEEIRNITQEMCAYTVYISRVN